jgi:hypothetical protein
MVSIIILVSRIILNKVYIVIYLNKVVTGVIAMKEFLLLIRKEKDSEDVISEEFLKACENYIKELKSDGKLIAAQPIDEEDNVVLSKNKSWKIIPANGVVGGYYHIRVKDLEEAMQIAKANPEFDYHPDAKIEVRPIKTEERGTGFMYPSDVIENLSFMDEMEVPF